MGNLRITNTAKYQYFNPELTTIFIGGKTMALLAPTITQSDSFANGGKLFVYCSGASTIYINSSLWSDRYPAQLLSTLGDSTLTGIKLPARGIGITAYGVDGAGNLSPSTSVVTY